MSNAEPPVTWARKVPQHKIRRLYQTDARGIVDEELIYEVGYSMFACCESILTVTEASQGRGAKPSFGSRPSRTRGGG